jgi:hypothetical protein
MEARDAAVSAVSLAEKNAETSRQAMTMANEIQSMATTFQFEPFLPSWPGKSAKHVFAMVIPAIHVLSLERK